MSEPEKPSSGEKNQPGQPAGGISRRDFVNEVACGALLIAGAGATVVTYRYLSPNVLFEPPARFHVGTPDDYPMNSVTYLRDQEVYIVRSTTGFSAISAICTHLGCITAWNPEADQIQCPCHGSKFGKDGTVVAGPAPRPLPHFSITLGPGGSLVVNKLEVVRQGQILKV